MSSLKRCTKCKKKKGVEDFYASQKYWCKECLKSKMQEGYSSAYWKRRWARGTDKERRRDTARDNYQKLFEYLEEHPCVDCGESNIVVLEFDHLRDKKGNVSLHVGNGNSWERVLQEINKCEVVCCNCHTVRTNERANTYKHQYKQHGTITTYRTLIQ